MKLHKDLLIKVKYLLQVCLVERAMEAISGRPMLRMDDPAKRRWGITAGGTFLVLAFCDLINCLNLDAVRTPSGS